MTKEALKELLEAVEAAIQAGDWKVDGACDPDLVIRRSKEALSKEKALQALHNENERLGLYKDAYAQLEECNFCPRCGKRNKDIHTCTPPQE